MINWIISILLGSGPIGWLIYALLQMWKINKYTKNIVIMGDVGSGKTTLWHQLKGDWRPSYGSTGTDKINDFTFTTRNDRKIRIVNGTDYGGSDSYIPYYLQLLSENTFVFYLVDLTNITPKAGSMTRARLQAIAKTFERNQQKGQGLKIVATKYGEYYNTYHKTRDEAAFDVEKMIGLGKIKKFHVKDKIAVVELREHSDIENIKEEIANA